MIFLMSKKPYFQGPRQDLYEENRMRLKIKCLFEEGASSCQTYRIAQYNHFGALQNFAI